jgi:hypothetical protein
VESGSGRRTAAPVRRVRGVVPMTAHRHRPYRDLPTHHHGVETFVMFLVVVIVGWVIIGAYAEAIVVAPRSPDPTTRHLCADTGPAPWQGVYVPGFTLSLRECP